ncbi:hypothetical protein B484DRAFT_406351 [Ochromonadaceae sp. CCMP2298]|nr:hypothetical protein B484DRAFT_406351 [Ochromonadaceae sp. CCMP2298]
MTLVSLDGVEIIALDTSRWKGRLNEWVQYVVYTAAPVFQLVYEFLSSPAWALLGPVLDALQVTFNVINGFLNTRISISGMPFVCWKDVWECVTVGYPSGAEQCCTKKCSFTIKEVLDGLMSVVQPLMDAMDLLMKKALKALNIQLPTITIPGLPSLYRLDRFFDGFLAFTHFGYSPWRGLSIQGHFDALEKLKDKMAVFATDVTCEDLRTTRWDAWMNGGSYE